MPITINGSGTVTGISAGGLPDDCITTADIAAGAVTQAKRSEQLTLDTAKASTSGTFIDFTGIPSWVKRVTVMFDGVSTSGTSEVLIQLGDAGGIETTGYASVGNRLPSALANETATSTAGFLINQDGAVFASSGHILIALHTSNLWVSSHTLMLNTSQVGVGGGSKTLSATLDRIRITTVNGTDTFDAGSINIMYE